MPEFIDKVAEELGVPKFYVELKVGRFGEKEEEVKASVEEDRAVCRAIGESLNMPERPYGRSLLPSCRAGEGPLLR